MFRTHIGPVERKEVGLLPVEVRVKQLKLIHMFDIIHKRAPENMNYQVDMVGSQHKCNTRAIIMSCSVPRVKRNTFNTFLYWHFPMEQPAPAY